MESPDRILRGQEGVLFDRADSLPAREFSYLIAIWRECTDRLNSSRVFPQVDIDDEDKFIELIEKAPRYRRPPK